jgi:plasmid stabilization system protein ParE
MALLIWTPPATQDAHRLYQFLAQKSPDAARRAIKAIRQGVQVLAKQPGIGRPAEEMPIEYREWIITFGDSGYVVLYRLEANAAYLLAVRHQREAGY